MQLDVEVPHRDIVGAKLFALMTALESGVVDVRTLDKEALLQYWIYTKSLLQILNNLEAQLYESVRDVFGDIQANPLTADTYDN